MLMRIFKILISYFLMTIRKVKDRLNPHFYSRNCRVRRIIKGTGFSESKMIAVFVIYRKHGVPFYIKNIIDQLERLKVSCWVSINDDASTNIIDWLSHRVCGVVLRKNFGHDFAAYKDLLSLVELKNCERLILLNDSAFYFSRDIDKLFDQLVNSKEDILPFTASTQYGWHAQSYLISLSSAVFNHKSFLLFWKNYKPYNSRRHAIFNGEIKLSREVFSLFEIGSPIYSKFVASNSIIHSSSVEKISNLIPGFVVRGGVEGSERIQLMNLFRNIESFNPSHGIPLICGMELGFCVLKRDVFFKGTFGMAFLVMALDELGIDNSEVAAAISEIESRGSLSELSWFDQLVASL